MLCGFSLNVRPVKEFAVWCQSQCKPDPGVCSVVVPLRCELLNIAASCSATIEAYI